jgi:hypothetical protein
MRVTQNLSLLLLAALCVSLLPMPVSALNDPIQGKWKVTIDPDEDARKAGEKSYDDTLIFNASQFTSDALKKKNFKPVDYDADTARFGPATFTAEPKSDTDGKMKWTGRIDATQMEGEITWTKKDGTEVHYTFKGEKT